jgi:predicted anti-sigma-YlaC factor YlaD
MVTDYLEGVLNEATLVRLEHHLSICEACREYFDQIRLVVSGLSTLPPPSLTPHRRQEIVDAFRQVRAQP